MNYHLKLVRYNYDRFLNKLLQIVSTYTMPNTKDNERNFTTRNTELPNSITSHLI